MLPSRGLEAAWWLWATAVLSRMTGIGEHSSPGAKPAAAIEKETFPNPE